MSEADDWITKDLTEIQEKVKTLKEKLKVKIQQLPDNPRIKRVKSNPHCFIMNSRDLGEGTVLSAEYHDFKIQYQWIVEMIDRETIEIVMKNIETIIKTGAIRYKESTLRFHPDVIKHLKVTTGGY